jgi:anhydro-N-acetylmuramic acid kinase
MQTRTGVRFIKSVDALKKNLQRRKQIYKTCDTKLSIGLMSGTSLDGVDCSIIETDGENYFEPIDNLYFPYHVEFQIKLRKLLDNYDNWLLIEKELTVYHADCVKEILKKANLSRKVDIIGFHGQTILHDPQQSITWQIGNPHLLAKLTGINVISDFRRRDLANGGQGAPLMPIFHKCLAQKESNVAILNIGGVSNITYITNNIMIAFDTGPGNSLINDAMVKHYNKQFDDAGKIGLSGIVNYSILDQLLDDEFFKKSPPKSLDRNYFVKYSKMFEKLKPEDMIATLTRFTVESINLGLKLLPNMPDKIYICGGGSRNITMMNWLQSSGKALDFKFPADFIEAQGFAYLAVRFLKFLPSSFPNTTLVNQETLSGVLFRL